MRPHFGEGDGVKLLILPTKWHNVQYFSRPVLVFRVPKDDFRVLNKFLCSLRMALWSFKGRFYVPLKDEFMMLRDVFMVLRTIWGSQGRYYSPEDAFGVHKRFCISL